MDIQSLSVVVPGGCPNRCRFCVSVLHPGSTLNQIEQNKRFRALYKRDFHRKMSFARDNGCNTIMLTGNGEPLINETFLNFFAEWNEKLNAPFRWIEIQTSGVTLDDAKLRWLRDEVGVSTISLSLSDIFSSDRNMDYNQTPERLRVEIDALCSEIKRYDFGLRLSMNMTDGYATLPAEDVFQRAKALGANQITFRLLYSTEGEDPHGINAWIQQHRCPEGKIAEIREFILRHGRPLERLPFGAMRYSVMGMSVVLDDDCMSTKDAESLKYLILQPNCKLYTKWDDEGSLLF
jgi:hypothetical protein